jgi:hypothetical protein
MLSRAAVTLFLFGSRGTALRPERPHHTHLKGNGMAENRDHGDDLLRTDDYLTGALMTRPSSRASKASPGSG